MAGSLTAHTRSIPEQRGWDWYDWANTQVRVMRTHHWAVTCEDSDGRWGLRDPGAALAPIIELLDQPGSTVSHRRDTSS